MRIIGQFLEDLTKSGQLQHLILNKNGLIRNAGLSDLTLSLSERMSLLNNIGTRSELGWKLASNVLMMPLQSLGLSEIGVSDQGFEGFSKSILETRERLSALTYSARPQAFDFYEGGMELNLRRNNLSYKSILTLSKLLEELDGFKSIDIGHQNSSLSQKWLERAKLDPAKQQQHQKSGSQSNEKQKKLAFVKLAR